MKPSTAILVLVAAAFGAFSSYVMLKVGYVGIWEAGLRDLGSMQVLLDLVVACLLISSWMIADARRTGRNPWPYVVLTLAAGSVGPLVYLLLGRFLATTPVRSLA